MSYFFKQEEIENIVNRFGNDFYEKVSRDIGDYAEKWALTAFQLIPSYAVNLVFTCRSKSYGDAVLKIGNPAIGESVKEYNALREYNGRRFCKVYEADPHNGVTLLERVKPGIPLRNERSLDKRLSVFCSLHENMHVSPAKADIYPTYTGWVKRITEYMSKRKDCQELYEHMKNAHDICTSVSAVYSRRLLLHGDLHHDNILLGPDGAYIAIDPKGVIGDPVFDVPRFILNEMDGEITSELYRKICDIIVLLAARLQIPEEILKQCLYVETAMAKCWNVEGGAKPEELPKLLEQVTFAEKF